jgi:peroxiredoxin
MKRITILITLFVLTSLAVPVDAHLAEGAAAPPFRALAAQGGNVREISLAALLAKGPIVLYFFPQSFTSGCTQEAHDFADHAAAFAERHATVVGISGDSIETQKKFSTLECRSKFLVASDPGLAIANSYQSVILNAYADRTSYVIAPDGKIVYSFTDLDPSRHVANTLAALDRLEHAR